MKSKIKYFVTFFVAGYITNSGHAQIPNDVVKQSWYDQAISNIQQFEYNISFDEKSASYQAPNRLHNFRSYFSESGLMIRPRVQTRSNWFVEMNTQKLYRHESEAIQLKSSTLNKSAGEKISFISNGILTSEYINTPNGVKSNYIIQSKVLGSGDLILELELKTDLTVTLEADIITFQDVDQISQIQCKNFLVYDMTGKILPSRIQLDDTHHKLLLITDDKDAVYPVVIDPLLISPAWAVEPNSSDAYFGFALKGAGDVNGDGYDDVIIGAQQYDNGSTDEGRAFCYLGSAVGLSTVASWTAESNQTSAYFGYCVSGAGDVNNDGYDDVIVGAHYYDNGSTDEGRVFLYLGSSTGLNTVAAWTAEANQSSARFGSNLDGGGDINNDGYDDILICAPYYDAGNTDEGRIYLYTGTPTGLSTTATWTFETNQTSALLNSMAFIGDVNDDGLEDVGAGAYLYDNGSTDEGKIYVFYNSPSGLPAAPSWSYEVNKVNSKLGNFVNRAGDVNGDNIADFIAGAYEYDEGTFDNSGKCFLFYGDPVGLASTPDWEYMGDYSGGKVGSIVAGVGDINGDHYDDFIITQPLYDDGTSGTAHKGRVFLLYGSEAGPSSTPNWSFIGTTPGVEAGSGYGAGYTGDVNNDGYNEIMIGSYSYTNGQLDEGHAQLFYGSPLFPVKSADDVISGAAASSSFGTVVKILKDVNNDGYMDVCISAPYFDNGSVDEGKVFGFWGSGTGFSDTPNWTAEGNQDYSNFGFSMDGIDDVNSDGYSDLIIGAPGFDHTLADQGRVYLFKGTSTGLFYLPSKTYTGLQASEKLGYAVEYAGDVNADGSDDFLISAPYHDGVITNDGIVYLYTGIPGTFPSSPLKTFTGTQTDALFGSVLTSIKDINDDGYDDILISSPQFDNAFTNTGKIFIIKGGNMPADISIIQTYEGSQTSEQFGFSAAGGGDVNGDSIADFLIGTPYFDFGFTDNGLVSLYYGSPSGPGATPDWKSYGFGYNSQLGYSVSIVGDYNGDGYADIAAGGIFEEFSVVDEGLVDIYFGSFIGPRFFPNLVLSVGQANSKFGTSLSSGDLNNDGLSDIIVSAPNFDYVYVDGGEAFMYYGTADSCGIITDIDLSPVSNAIGVNVSSSPDLPVTFVWFIRKYGDIPWISGTSSENSFTITDLDSCTAYEIEIQSICPSGSSDKIFQIVNTTGCTDDCSPIEVSGLTVIGLSNTSAMLSWWPVAGVLNYSIEYRISGTITWTIVPVLGYSTTVYSLDSCTLYEFSVQADCIIPGPWSPIVLHTTSTCVEPCEEAPAGVYADPVGSTSATIHWNPVIGATKYKVYYRPDGGSWININSTSTTKTITGLSPLTNYQCRVKGVCPAGFSPYSSIISFSTTARLGEESNLFSVYPNPGNENFTILINNVPAEEVFIIVTDIKGSIIKNEQLFLENGIAKLSIDAAPGIYQIQVIAENLSRSTRVVISN